MPDWISLLLSCRHHPGQEEPGERRCRVPFHLQAPLWDRHSQQQVGTNKCNHNNIFTEIAQLLVSTFLQWTWKTWIVFSFFVFGWKEMVYEGGDYVVTYRTKDSSGVQKGRAFWLIVLRSSWNKQMLVIESVEGCIIAHSAKTTVFYLYINV